MAYLDDGNAWAAERLAREPGWVLDAALSHAGDSKVFAAYLHSAGAHEIADLRLGKKTEQLYADAEKLHRQLDRYAYGPPPVRFAEQDVDQARAAGVLIEFERGRPIIVDRPLYRELVKGAIKRTYAELEAKATAAAKEKKDRRTSKQPADLCRPLDYADQPGPKTAAGHEAGRDAAKADSGRARGEMEDARLASRETCVAAIAVTRPDRPVGPGFRPAGL